MYTAASPDPDPNPRGGGQLPNPNPKPNEWNEEYLPQPYIDVNDRGHRLRSGSPDRLCEEVGWEILYYRKWYRQERIKLYIWNLQITRFKMIHNMFVF